MNKLIITSVNPDYSGTWVKAEVEQAMREIDCPGNWMDYILDHALDCKLPAKIQDAFVNEDGLKKVVVDIEGEEVIIVKH